MNDWSRATGGLPGLAVHRVLVVVRAELLDLQAVRVVAPVLPGDVVAALALLAGQRDLRAEVGGGMGGASLGVAGYPVGSVAGRGLEPATQRLGAVCSARLSYPAPRQRSATT